MKNWIYVAIIAGLLLVGVFGTTLVNAENSENQESETIVTAETCGGTCSAGSSCSNQECGAKIGKSCNCGR
ncbi:hypothetical protein HOD88_01125 [archaeon]|jgi:hypothetical protein|nr:hypothetical protein [archaeon]